MTEPRKSAFPSIAETYKDLRVSFDPKYLLKVFPFKAQHDIRYYLNGVYVEKAERGGVYIVATDGHMMAIVHDASGTIEGFDHVIFSVDPGMVPAAKKAVTSSKGGMNYRVTVEGTRAQVTAGDGLELFIQPGRCVIEGKYPDWQKVLPDFSKLEQGVRGLNQFNAEYIARVERVISDKFRGITFWQEHPEKALVIQITATPEMIVVVMPMRHNDSRPANEQFKLFDFPKPAPAPAPEAEATTA